MKEQFTILVYTENKVGLLQRVVSTFSRRKINIESLNTSESGVPGIFRFTIVVESQEEWVRKTVKNIERQVEVHKAYYFRDEDLVYQEIALYKVPTKVLAANGQAEELVRRHHARVLGVEDDFTILEK
ncbi:MAG TPA: acetolactate synthase small subunit, partial [Cytophagales bacterium]|nr:acetolactate synthase small subunit [Cytophagales bacterium]